MELTIIQSKIYEVRGQKIMLDFDLANLYEVETRTLNQSVKRNIKRFPIDFMFQLSKEEWQTMSSQIVMTYPEKRPKTATPYAFTEQGLALLSGILNSDVAINVNIGIMRAFVLIRQYALTWQDYNSCNYLFIRYLQLVFSHFFCIRSCFIRFSSHCVPKFRDRILLISTHVAFFMPFTLALTLFLRSKTKQALKQVSENFLIKP